MKTLIRFTLSVLSFALPLALMGCGSSNNGSTTTAATPYGYVNGVCYNTSLNTPAATSYCTGATSTQYVTNSYGCYDSINSVYVSSAYCSALATTATVSGYTYSNGICYSTSTGQQVPATYCTATASSYSALSCVGPYYYSNGYTSQLVQCNGANCRGYVLYNVQTKQPVVCQ